VSLTAPGTGVPIAGTIPAGQAVEISTRTFLSMASLAARHAAVVLKAMSTPQRSGAPVRIAAQKIATSIR